MATASGKSLTGSMNRVPGWGRGSELQHDQDTVVDRRHTALGRTDRATRVIFTLHNPGTATSTTTTTTTTTTIATNTGQCKTNTLDLVLDRLDRSAANDTHTVGQQHETPAGRFVATAIFHNNITQGTAPPTPGGGSQPAGGPLFVRFLQRFSIADHQHRSYGRLMLLVLVLLLMGAGGCRHHRGTIPVRRHRRSCTDVPTNRLTTVCMVRPSPECQRRARLGGTGYTFAFKLYQLGSVRLRWVASEKQS
uniref:Uncharacterized protein n=1 Tax=Anopheles farauti TaxID=69004 RepID=A0A182QM32_9DIPT